MTISFTTTHGELYMALNAITALSASRPALPILGTVRITAGAAPNMVSVDYFDFDTHVSVVLKAEVAHLPNQLGESVVVNRAELAERIRSLTAGSTRAKQSGLPVTIGVEGANLIVEADGYTYTLTTVDPKELPDLPRYGIDGDSVTVDRDAMLTAITRLQISAGHDQTLPMLTGINFHSVDSGLELCTTDRFRMSLAFVPTLQAEHHINRLLPAKQLATIFRHLPAGEVECWFSTTKGADWVQFISGPVMIGTKWLDTEFVKYASLVPTKQRGDAVVTRNDLAVAVKRAQAAIGSGSNGGLVRLQLAGSRVKVTGDYGGVELMASPPFRTEQNGDDLEGPIAFNPTYLGDALSAFASDAVSIRYSKPDRPVLIAEPGELDNPRAFRTLVMPTRLAS